MTTDNNGWVRVEDRLPEDDKWDDTDVIEFVPCLGCDGHPACEDFGCAYKLGIDHLVESDTV